MDALEKRHEGVRNSRTFRNLRSAFALGTKCVLDIGCGYGEYLKLCGTGSVGITTTPEEVAYGKSHSLPILLANAEDLGSVALPGPFDVVWANNLFEHLLAPHAFLMRVRTVVVPHGRIILGVPVVPVVPALMRFRRFRGALASNHINFFTRGTLTLTAERAGWVVEHVRPFIFINPILDRLCAPFAPHLYLVAHADQTFSYPAKKLKEWEGQEHYADLLTIGKPS